jgi:hypothetical protein
MSHAPLSPTGEYYQCMGLSEKQVLLFRLCDMSAHSKLLVYVPSVGNAMLVQCQLENGSPTEQVYKRRCVLLSSSFGHKLWSP